MSGENLKSFTDNTFASEVIGASLPVIVDLWAPWCGPCRMLTPIINGIAPDYAGKAIIGALNVDENPQTASTYDVNTIPTILFFKNGSVVAKHVGLIAKDALKAKIDAIL